MLEYDEFFDEIITVLKLDEHGAEKIRYDGRVIARGETWVCLQAPFSVDSADLGAVVFRRGDRFTEWFFTDRWYNIFRVEDAKTQQLKAWYCNITRPAQISEEVVMSEDLALDVLVLPDGAFYLLDQDEFAALNLPEAQRHAALAAVDELKTMVADRLPPFEEIS